MDPIPGLNADQALEYVTGVFGLDPSLIGSLIGSPWSPGIIAEMSHVLNATALLAATALTLWTFVVGTLNTGRHGSMQAGGQGQGGVWVPMRQVYAIALLVPVIKGYSIIQVLVLLFAYLGWQAADLAWDSALGYLETEGPVVNVPVAGSGELGRSLVAAHACMIRANQTPGVGPSPRVRPNTTASRGVGRAGQTRGSHLPTRWVYSLSLDGAPGSGFGTAVCGQFVVEHPYSSPSRRVAELMHREAAAAFQRLSLAANALALEQSTRRLSATDLSARLTAAVNAYEAEIRAGAARVVSGAADDMDSDTAAFFDEARDAGWITAGAWYWTVSAVNRRIADLVRAQPAVVVPDTSRFPPSMRSEVDIALARLDYQFGRAGLMASAGRAGTEYDLEHPGSDPLLFSDPWEYLSRKTSDAMSGVLSASMVGIVGDDGDALSHLQSKGHLIIGGAEVLAATTLAAQALASTGTSLAADNVLAKTLGFFTGGKEGLKTGVNRVITWLTVAGSLIAFYLLFLGVLLAYYLPAIPYLLWVAGVFGWLVMLFEAIVAVPFWAAAHAAPEGDGISGQRARQGYMLVLGLIARPLLMVFGLIGSLIVAKIGALFLLATFDGFARAMHTEHTMGLVSLLAMITLFVIAAITGARRAFTLIYLVPDRVLRWIGGGVEQLGEREDEAESNRYFLAASNRTEGAVGKGGDEAKKVVAGEEKETRGQEVGTLDRQDQQTGGKTKETQHLP